MTWSDEMAEALFTPVPGGYLFEAPTALPFGIGLAPRRFYQVNDVEKAELIARRSASITRWQWLVNVVSGAILALIAAASACFVFVGIIAGLACIVGAIVLPFAAIMVVHISKVRAIAPVLSRLAPSAAPQTSRREAFAREAEAVRRGMSSDDFVLGAPIGSWFQGWNATGISGLMQAGLKTQMRIGVQVESWVARGIYWLAVLVGIGLCGFWAWLVVHDGYARDEIMLSPAALAVALFAYFLGWAWRWLWTGRTDHLFEAATYTPPGQLDEMRKNITSLLALRPY